MYILEIETIKKIKEIQNPKKARSKDCTFFDLIQVMDKDEVWHTICIAWFEFPKTLNEIIDSINIAIKNKAKNVYLNI